MVIAVLLYLKIPLFSIENRDYYLFFNKLSANGNISLLSILQKLPLLVSANHLLFIHTPSCLPKLGYFFPAVSADLFSPNRIPNAAKSGRQEKKTACSAKAWLMSAPAAAPAMKKRMIP